MWEEYISATNLEEVLAKLAEYGDKARIVAGATDLMLEMERGQRKGIKTLIDITRIPGLDQIVIDEDQNIHLGPLVTHNHCVGSKVIRQYAFPLAQACWEVGSPQIRNRGTVVGNLVTASPANDTISPLMALGAKLTIKSLKGERIVALEAFYSGVRRTVLQPDEMVVDISFPALKADQHGMFIKFALRRAQAISLVNVTVLLSMEEDVAKNAVITLGAVAPTIIHARDAETFLTGKVLDEATVEQAAELAMSAARPISDVRGSAGYRKTMVRVITKRALKAAAAGLEKQNFPEEPVLLWGGPRNIPSQLLHSEVHNQDTFIKTTINGKSFVFEAGQNKSLLRLLREEAGLVGTKEGCAEGECGACTIHLDGIAVMGCLVPAPRAHLAEIVTVEGLANGEQLHPVQSAFVEEGAVQCGYCTPGFLMSASKLLEERVAPNSEEIKQAITGNLCRCTGYYKIIKAIEKAAQGR
jgi:carbon-monoxide dehydrogenase medium subunit